VTVDDLAYIRPHAVRCDLRRLADVQELLIAIRLGPGRAG